MNHAWRQHGDTHLRSKHSGGWARRIKSLRWAWVTQQDPVSTRRIGREKEKREEKKTGVKRRRSSSVVGCWPSTPEPVGVTLWTTASQQTSVSFWKMDRRAEGWKWDMDIHSKSKFEFGTLFSVGYRIKVTLFPMWDKSWWGLELYQILDCDWVLGNV